MNYATTEEYIARITEYGRPELLDLWNNIKERNTAPEWEPGKALEFLILRAFELEEAEIKWPFSVTKGGMVVEQIDGVIHIHDFGISVMVECKDQETAINIEPIAKIRNQLLRRSSNAIGAVFSCGGFTEPALILAEYVVPQTILLWEKNHIELCLNRGVFIMGMKLKYRHAIEMGIPNFNIESIIP